MLAKNLDIRNIVFDFGGVIIDIDPYAIVNQMNKMGFSVVDKMREPAFFDIVKRFEKGIIKASTFREEVKNYLNISISDAFFDEMWNSMLFDIPERRINLVKQLKQNYHVYLLSNTNEIHYDMFVRDLQLRYGYREFDNLFDKAFFSFDLHLAKPDPDIYRLVLDSYDMLPDQTLFIDDTDENIEAARSLGIHTLKVEMGSRIVDLFKDGMIKGDVEVD